MEKQILDLDGLVLHGDGWKFAEKLVKDEDTYTDSEWPGCDYRVMLPIIQVTIGVNVKITGRVHHYVGWKRYKMRAKIEYVGDGEPSTFGGGWVFFDHS